MIKYLGMSSTSPHLFLKTRSVRRNILKVAYVMSFFVSSYALLNHMNFHIPNNISWHFIPLPQCRMHFASCNFFWLKPFDYVANRQTFLLLSCSLLVFMKMHMWSLHCLIAMSMWKRSINEFITFSTILMRFYWE